MEQSDEKLLQACRRGDGAAWEALVMRYRKLIYTIPRRAGLDEDAAADVFQEVFTTLFEKVEGIEQPERLHAWLVTTARRKTWRAIMRSRMLQQQTDGDETGESDFENLPHDAPLPDEVLVKLEEQQRVRTALGGLDERCRKLLTVLFYSAEPPPYSEIAVMLGTTEGSIGPTRARCLQKLLKSLEKTEN